MLIAPGTLIVVSVSVSGPAVEVISSQARVPFCSSTYTRWLSERATNQIGGGLGRRGRPTLFGQRGGTRSHPRIAPAPRVATETVAIVGGHGRAPAVWPDGDG